MRQIEAQVRERLSVEILPILNEPSAAIEPRNAFRQDHKSADLIGTFDDFNVEMRQNLCKRFRKFGLATQIPGTPLSLDADNLGTITRSLLLLSR